MLHLFRMSGRPTPALIAAAGLLALLLAMGIGRFAFTALLPQMRDEGFLDIGSGGLLAAMNYLGYLAGALWTAFSRQANGPRRLLGGLLASVATTLAMGFEPGFAGWCGLRLVSGVASAVVYVYATGIVLRSLADAGAAGWSALHYMGVGSGIVVSALVAQSMADGGGALLLISRGKIQVGQYARIAAHFFGHCVTQRLTQRERCHRRSFRNSGVGFGHDRYWRSSNRRWRLDNRRWRRCCGGRWCRSFVIAANQRDDRANLHSVRAFRHKN